MEETGYIRFALAFIFVLALIGTLPFVLRKLSLAKKWAQVQDGASRLHIVEMRYLDPKRRLVLVRRDDTEHLLLLSAEREMLVEANIKTPANNNPTLRPANDHA